MPKKDNKLIIYEKMTQLIFYSRNLLKKFPKSETFDLCADIKNNLYENLRNIIYAWKEKNNEIKMEMLKKIDVDIFILKTFVRLSYQYKYITPKNYMVWDEKISEIGKMIGGWQKTCQKE